ncbi:MAG TPA: metalloregulator ArsR/SmtB family transcription factor [Polyangiaceae bacterium]|nr:metalloregulator ArsR/SmtB family transcription factor [Polyangiaceae bacterium]
MADAKADAIFRALADPTRRAVFERLARREHAVKDLTARFDVSQAAISQHLSALRKAGLVAHRREGRQAFYSAKRAGLRPLIDWISHYQSFWKDHMQKLETLLEELEE